MVSLFFNILGETWNPFKLSLQLRHVRERLAKNLVEKQICISEKQNFVLFEMMTHPLVNTSVKECLICRIQDVILNKWSSDINKIEKRLFALIMLAHHSDVLENALLSLSDSDYDIAKKRIEGVLQRDYFLEANKEGAFEILWAVIAALNS